MHNLPLPPLPHLPPPFAARVHMGNMTKDFVPVGKEEQAEIKDPTNCEKVAELLGIDCEWMITYSCKPKLRKTARPQPALAEASDQLKFAVSSTKVADQSDSVPVLLSTLGAGKWNHCWNVRGESVVVMSQDVVPKMSLVPTLHTTLYAGEIKVFFRGIKEALPVLLLNLPKDLHGPLLLLYGLLHPLKLSVISSAGLSDMITADSKKLVSFNISNKKMVSLPFVFKAQESSIVSSPADPNGDGETDMGESCFSSSLSMTMSTPQCLHSLLTPSSPFSSRESSTTCLHFLHLFKNRLETLDKSSLAALTNLTHLNQAENEVEDINGLLITQVNLQQLNISSNKMLALPRPFKEPFGDTRPKQLGRLYQPDPPQPG